jgi:hypothetical protein
MSPAEKLLDRREIAADVYMPLAFRTIALIVVLVLLYFIAGPGETLAPFFLPIAASAVAWYLGSVFPIIFEGRMVPALRDVCRTMMIVLFTVLTFSAFSGTSIYSLPVVLVGSALAVYLLGAAYSDDARLVARAVLLEGVGLSILIFTGTSASADISLLGEIICGGFTMAAVLGLAGLLSGHTSKFVSHVGAYLGKLSTIALVCVVFIGVLAYGQFLRPGLATSLGGNLVIVEWLALLTALAVAGYRIWSFARTISADRQFGDLQTLVQKISYDRKHLETASSAVNGFVEQGRKEGLIVYLTRVMLDNGAPPKAIEGLIAGIVRCQDDPEPPLLWRWTKGDLVRRNRERRLAVVNDTVAAAAGLVKPGPVVAYAVPAREAAPPENENDLTIT